MSKTDMLRYYIHADFNRFIGDVFGVEPDTTDQWQNEMWQAFQKLGAGLSAFDAESWQRLVKASEAL